MRYSYHEAEPSIVQYSVAKRSKADQRLQSSVLVVLRVISAVFVPQSGAERSEVQLSLAKQRLQSSVLVIPVVINAVFVPQSGAKSSEAEHSTAK